MIEPADESSEETQLRREQKRYGAVVMQRNHAFVDLNQQQSQDPLENVEGIDIVTGRVAGNIE